jgi:hypothetical protein
MLESTSEGLLRSDVRSASRHRTVRTHKVAIVITDGEPIAVLVVQVAEYIL